jgi:hypothetical protein
VKKIRKRLTYANVMSSIAVFLVLGGATALAAGLAKNSVGSKQLKKNAVTAAKIKNNAVTGSKIQAAAVDGSKIAVGAVTAAQLGDGSVGTSKLADGAVTTGKLGNDAVTGDKVKESTLGQVPSAANADTVGGNHVGFVHVTFSGTTPSVDPAQSSPGVTVEPSNPFVASTSCVRAPFTLHAVTGTVDFIADPGSSEIVEAAVVTGTGHRCPEGTIEVNTQNANANTGVTIAYYLMFT